jgi:hypothetical protein
MTYTPCALLTGAVKTACENAQATVPGNNGTTGSSGSSGIFSGPGSDWWRHAMFRIVEVIVGIAMVIAGAKALTASSSTVNVVAKGVKKAATA